MTAYLDCNATTPIEPQVAEIIIKFMTEDFGNAASRTHAFGAKAKQAVQAARKQVADVVAAEINEVIFTSGATESNNAAILGLADFGQRENKRHIISTQIEHKSVLEPLSLLEEQGFEITLLKPNEFGWVDPSDLKDTLREETLLVSVMHANNETGVIQPIADIAQTLASHPAYFHVDAAQGYGKLIDELQYKRIDLISISGHKIYGPKGIGALIARRRGYKKPPLKPMMHGGGQEAGLRPGTAPVPLIAGLGLAAELAMKNYKERNQKCLAIKEDCLAALASLEPRIHGDSSRTLPNTLNLSIPGLDSEAAIVALKDIAAISNGSACTSSSHSLSHVLKAMDIPDNEIEEAIRISWCHLTGEINWLLIKQQLEMGR